MKTEDFERLKEICEKSNYDIVAKSETNILLRKKKDLWECVEFVECITIDSSEKGKIYKVKKITEIQVIIDLIDEYGANYCFLKEFCQPSTESAYVEQLKKEAVNRFGEIKEGDVFINANGQECVSSQFEKLCYVKTFDQFYYYGILIYKQGKWAERVKESIKVTYIDWGYQDNAMEINFFFKINDWETVKDKDDVGEYLAEQLEKYINNE